MNRAQRLLPILELAEKKEKETAQAYAAQAQKIQVLRQGSASLHGFLNNYHARYQHAGAAGLTVKQLEEYRAFLGKINQAIEEQSLKVQQAEVLQQTYRLAWNEARQRKEGLMKLIEQAKREAARRAAKQEQADMDERSARKAARAGARVE